MSESKTQAVPRQLISRLAEIRQFPVWKKVQGASGLNDVLCDIIVSYAIWGSPSLFTTIEVGSDDKLQSASELPGSTDLVVGVTDNGNIFVFDLFTKEMKLRMNGHVNGCNCVLGLPPIQVPNILRFASTSDDDTVKIWRLEVTGNNSEAHKQCVLKDIHTISNHTSDVEWIWCTDTNKLLTAARDDTCGVFSLEDYSELVRFEGHSNSNYAVAQLSDDVVASGGADLSIQVWSMSTGVSIIQYRGFQDQTIRCIQRLAHNRLICSGDCGVIVVCDIDNPKPIGIYKTEPKDAKSRGSTEGITSIITLQDNLFVFAQADRFTIVEFDEDHEFQTVAGPINVGYSIRKLSTARNKDLILIAGESNALTVYSFFN